MRGRVFLVDPSHPLPEGFECAELSPALPGSEVMLERCCAEHLTALIDRIGAAGRIVAVSGYRAHSEQVSLWDDTVRTHGEAFTRQYVAIPGCSEHETGLAIDLALNNGEEIDFIRPNFPRDGICRDFRALAAEYGFIERYQAGKEHITHISAEPWHFRYVGAHHARYIAGHGLSLEEYIEQLSSGDTCPGCEARFIPCGAELPDGGYVVEDSNAGGLIITPRRPFA